MKDIYQIAQLYKNKYKIQQQSQKQIWNKTQYTKLLIITKEATFTYITLTTKNGKQQNKYKINLSTKQI